MTAKKEKPGPASEIQPRRLAKELVDAVIEVSKLQANIIREMKEALEKGDDETALEKARELTGLPSKHRP